MVGEVQSSNSPNVALEGNEVPIESNAVSLTQEVQSTPNEINIENQDPEAPVEPTTSPNKRGLKSDAWPYFKRQKIGGIWKAICKSCDKKIGGDTKNGTKHLFDHISICPKRTERGPKQAMLKVTEKKFGNRHESFVVGNYTFNQDVSRTVASESAFSTSGRVLSQQRSRLKEDTLEALMCTQDWIRKDIKGYSKTLTQFECVDEDMDDDDDDDDNKEKESHI
ncbi:uncharacterized protein LOC131639873 [Vicia villosa]|uniref:uncharacterized protein LOC131639873 n=1 Tax=Vicia villosa TaxID=3911 RepID=UPI00273C274D|nr:uncharacterized protein LOC131639873 [Vicia villosa]